MASFGPSDILQHGEELKSILTRVGIHGQFSPKPEIGTIFSLGLKTWFKPISDPWTRVAYATTQTLSESLNDQNRAVLAALGFVAALATGGLAVQIIKKVRSQFHKL